VGPNCFATLSLPLRTGRQFDWHNNSTETPRAIVSESLAKALYPNGSALGRRVAIGSDPGGRKLEIVGIVGDARLWKVQGDPPPAIYIPLLQTNSNEQQLVIRTAIDPAMLIPAVRREIEVMGHESVRSAKLLED
jgi:putative ABC transport system permease protein